MPHRLVCVAILSSGSVAAVGLIRRDLLPDLIVGRPPTCGRSPRPTRTPGPTALGDPGRSTTRRAREPPRRSARRDRVEADGRRLGRRSPARSGSTRGACSRGRRSTRPPQRRADRGQRAPSRSTPRATSSHFRASVRPAGGRRRAARSWRAGCKDDAIEVVAPGPLPILNRTRTLPVRARGVVQNALGPLDRLPGLQVGQRWESQVVSPLTGQVETVARRGGAARRSSTGTRARSRRWRWSRTMTPLSARTWVRPDGLVLRQEVPFPFVKLVLERLPEPTPTAPRPRGTAADDRAAAA